MNEKYVIDKIKEIEEAGATPKEHTHTVSDISDMPSTFTPAAHNHAAGEITSGTLDAARIPALDAGKITSGTLDTARIPALTSDKITDLDTKISEGITGAIGDADISSFDSRITALEKTIPEEGVINATEIYVDNITSINFTNESGIIGALKLSNEVTLASNDSNSTTRNTYTYRGNPFTNTITFVAYAYSNAQYKYGRAYVQINGATVLDTGSIYDNPVTISGTGKTVTLDITLNDGDVITAVGVTSTTSARGTVTMKTGGYLVY